MVIHAVNSTKINREALTCVVVEKIVHPKNVLSYHVAHKSRIIKENIQRYLLMKILSTTLRLIDLQEIQCILSVLSHVSIWEAVSNILLVRGQILVKYSCKGAYNIKYFKYKKVNKSHASCCYENNNIFTNC